MKIGIYGGTFSPVHNGHVRAALLFMEYVKLDKLMIMPAGIPPHKEMKCPVSAETRLEMCKAAYLSLSPIVEVSDYEIKKEGKSYTVLTVEHFEDEGELCILCGEDMICCLDSWYRAEELMKKAEFAVMARKDDGLSRVEAAAERLRREYGAKITVIKEPALEISSTGVREAIKSGLDVAEMVPPAVLDIINEKGLYRN